MKENFYLVEYKGGSLGCPIFLEGEENNEWEWEIYDPNPSKFEITKSYEFKITDNGLNELELDYAGSPRRFVSERFIKLCDELNVLYRSVPVAVYLSSGIETRKKYFYFLSAQWASLVNQQRSEYKLEEDVPGSGADNKYYAGVKNYAWIKKLVVSENVGLDFFWCAEFMQHACSERFMKKAQSLRLQGIEYIPLDDSFRYDPWGDLE